jgi:putative holliday junction resolvase
VDGQKKRRILALDVGNRRIGLAVTDEAGMSALSLRTLERTSLRHDIEVIGKVARKHDVTEMVIGRPLHMSGEASAQSKKVEAFAEKLRDKLQRPIHWVDERLTSWQANELLDERGLSRTERKGKVDEIAAVLILEAYLENLSQSHKDIRK